MVYIEDFEFWLVYAAGDDVVLAGGDLEVGTGVGEVEAVDDGERGLFDLFALFGLRAREGVCCLGEVVGFYVVELDY